MLSVAVKPPSLLRRRDPSLRRGRDLEAVVIDLRPRPGMVPLVVVASGTLILAVVLGALANAAFVARYTAVVLPLFLMLIALGVAVLGRRRLVGGTLAVLCVAGLGGGLEGPNASRG